MGQPPKILVATDLSDAADEAMRQADARARALGAELGVCLVLPELLGVHPLFPQQHQGEAEQVAGMRVKAEEALTATLAAIRGDAPFQTFVEIGRADVEVVRRAEAWGADLVVVGSHGATGLARTLLGGTAESILRHAHCPVLVARPPQGGRRVLVGTDFSDPALPAVRAAADEARRTGATLSILHSVGLSPAFTTRSGFDAMASPWVMSPDVQGALESSTRERLAKALDAVGATGDALVSLEAPAPAILAAAERERADLVVVGTAGRTGLRRVLLGSVAERVGRLAPCSVLVVRLGGGSRA